VGRERPPTGRAWGEEGGSQVGVAHAPLASDGGIGSGSDSVTGGTERRPLTFVEVADYQRPVTLPRSGCGRCQSGRIEYNLRSTKGNGAPEFRFPHPVPLQGRSMTAARGPGSRYNRSMKRDAAEILKDALALPTEARAALAGSLLDSLDTEVDEDAEAAWATEVNRRVAELDSGAVKTIPWAEVRRRLAAR
jgi:putative addiction module component (TIGR02574 family)